MNRKERRAAAARRRKGDPEQAMTDKIAMFGKLPKKCSACEKSFDKQRGLDYINEKFRQTFKSKYGGINSIIKSNKQ